MKGCARKAYARSCAGFVVVSVLATLLMGSPAHAAATVDCDSASDDVVAVQSAIDVVPDGATITLAGVCDFRDVGAHGGDITTIVRTAVLVRPGTPVNGLTITSDGASQSATILGSGTQAAFTVAPGNDDVTITGLRFVNLGRAVVALNTSGTTVGSMGSVPSDDANRIIGGATMDSAILGLAVGRNPESASPGTVEIAYGTGSGSATFTGQSSAVLSDFAAVGNYISFNPPGLPNGVTDVTAVDVRQRFANVVDGVTIARNAVGMFASEFPHFNTSAIKIHSTTPASVGADPALSDYFIRDVTIQGNNLGRLEELKDVGPVADIHAAGRAAIVLMGVGDFDVSGNGVRTRMSTTAIPMPGGGIVAADSAFGRIAHNGIIVVHDPSTESSDLGAIGVIDDLNVLFGETAKAHHTGQVAVEDNIIGTVDGDTPGLGAQRALMFNGADHVSATGNNVKFSSAEAVNLGVAIEGPGNPSNIGPKTVQKAVTEAVVCNNSLDGTEDNTSEVAVEGASTSNAFPGGAGDNVDCGITLALSPTLLGSDASLDASGTAWPARQVTVEVSDATTTLTGTAVADADGSYAVSFNAGDIAGLDDGALSATATVADDLIAALTASANASATKDTLGPDVAIDTVTDPINSATASAVQASGTTEPGATLSLVAADAAVTEVGPVPVSVASDGTWSATGLDLSGLADGTITFTATATDAGGNSGSDSLTATKATGAPEIDVTSITDPISAAVADSVGVSGTSVPGLTVNVQIGDGTTTTGAASTLVDALGGWSVTGIDVTGLSDGTVTASATVTDGDGNTGAASLDALKDTVSQIEIVSAPALVDSSTASSVPVSGTAEPNASVDLTATDGTVTTAAVSVAADPAGDWAASLDLSSLSDGTVTVSAEATDALANTGSDAVDIVKDVVAPTIAFTSVTDPITPDNQQVISAAGTGDPGATVTVVVGAGTNSTAPAQSVVAADGTWGVGPINGINLLSGAVTYTATSIDEAGNVTSAVREAVKVGAQSGVVEILSSYFGYVSDENIVNGRVRVKVRQPGPDTEATSMKVTDATTTLNAGTVQLDAGAEHIFTVLAEPLADGTITATATIDGVKYQHSAILDRGAPTGEIDAPSPLYVSTPVFSNTVFTGTAKDHTSPIESVIVILQQGSNSWQTWAKRSTYDNHTTWSASFKHFFLSQGEYSLTAYAVDAAGNRGPSVSSETFRIL